MAWLFLNSKFYLIIVMYRKVIFPPISCSFSRFPLLIFCAADYVIHRQSFTLFFVVCIPFIPFSHHRSLARTSSVMLRGEKGLPPSVLVFVGKLPGSQYIY